MIPSSTIYNGGSIVGTNTNEANAGSVETKVME